MDLLLGQLVLAMGWLAFGLVHTATAGAALRGRMAPRWRPFYRIGYNCVAALQFALLLWLEHKAFFGSIDFGWPPVVQWALWGVLGVGVVVLIVALQRYDLRAFSGLSEAGNAIQRAKEGATREAADNEPEVEDLRTDGIHRYVRHPLYTGLFLIFWGRVLDDQTLATAVWASVYLVIGTHYEERRLIRLYGDAYIDYRRKVPAFFPLPGRRAKDIPGN